MSIRINRKTSAKDYGVSSVLMEPPIDVKRVNGKCKTYNINKANTPKHIAECWERCKGR